MHPCKIKCLLAALAAIGCMRGAGEKEPDVGAVRLALAEVPEGVSCFVLVVTGASRSAVKRMPMPPGRTQVEATVGGLPTGEVSLAAAAYREECSAAIASVTPSWTSDQIRLTLEPGKVAAVELTLRRNGVLGLTASFDDRGSSAEDCRLEGDRLVCDCVGTCTARGGTSIGVDDFLASLPPADRPIAIDELVSRKELRVDDGAGPFDCSTEIRRVVDVLEEIPQLTAANSNVLPGLAYGSRAVADGSMNVLPVRRGGLRYVIDLPIGESYLDVPEVTVAAAQQAVSTLQRRAGDTLAPARLTYTSEVVSSFEQAAHSLKVSVKAQDALRQAGFGLLASGLQSYSRRAIVARLVQPVYTIAVSDDAVERASQFFARGVTTDDLKNDGAIGPTNLPTFMKAVTYGRVLYLAIVTDEATSAQELSLAVNASFTGFEGSVAARETYTRIMGRAEYRVLALGGSQADALEALRTGDYSLFFKPVKAADAVPIAYRLQYMHRDRGTVAVRSALEYSVRDCTRCLLEPLWDREFLHAEERSCGFPGGSADYHLGRSCGSGWQRDRVEIIRINGSHNCGGGSWSGDDPGNCTAHLHVGCSAWNGGTCQIRIHRKRLTPGQPPLCRYSPG